VTGRLQQVVYNGQLSPIELLRYGVSQGSVLGPVLFSFYTADVSQIATNHRLSQHQYADDCQVYLSVQVQDAALSATRLSSCITDIAVPAEGNGDLQTLICVFVTSPIVEFTLLNLFPNKTEWQFISAALCG